MLRLPRQNRIAILLLCMLLASWSRASAQIPEQCDPKKIITAANCAKCHASEVEVWKHTKHFRTFDELHRSPRAKEIAQKMGVSSIKRSTVCTQCHYTLQDDAGTAKTMSGISCESCHGAAKDWAPLHNDYGGPGVTRLTESPEHREDRIRNSVSAGMRNPHNLYLIARSCLGCHTVPDEKLVNVGGHDAGSEDFDFVAWSQGKVKHNFLSHDGKNVPTSSEKLRVMHVIGLVADLEFSVRATAEATAKSKYGMTVAQRAVTVALKLDAIQQKLQSATLGEIIQAFAAAQLRTQNSSSLLAIADEIRILGTRLSDELDGSTMNFLDQQIPPPSKYK